MKLEWPKVFVTGVPGWLSSRLVQVIESGMESDARFMHGLKTKAVHTLGLVAPETRGPHGILEHYTQCDLRDKAGVANFFETNGSKGGLLFHIAGVIHPNKASEFEAINHQGTRNILAAAEAAGISRVVVMSSNSPFGKNSKPTDRFNESAPYKPYMGYGRSKMRMEKAVKEFQSRGKIETVIIRAPWFYGPGQPARQSLFFRMIREGRAPIVGSGENQRSMSFVDNLCQGLLLAAVTPHANGKAYWIADRRPYPMNEIVGTIEMLMEKEFGLACKHKRMQLPGLASQVASLVDASLQAVGLYHQKIHVLSEMNQTIACDISLAEKELGYDPKFDLTSGMRASIRWALAQGHVL